MPKPQTPTGSTPLAPSGGPAPATLPTRSAFRRLLPGLLICLAGGAIALVAAQLLPVSALLVAILLGAIWRNTLPVSAAFAPGIALSSKRLLRCGIVLLGLQLSLSTILGLGPGVLLVVVLSVGLTFAGTVLVGKWLGIELPQRLLIAAGFSICGAAAVAATEGVTRAKQQQVATAIGLVVLFGTLMIPLAPALGTLAGLDERSTGMFIGAATHEVAQVVAAGGAVGTGALAVAVTVKLARVVLLAPIMAGLGLYMRRRHAIEQASKPPLVPLFVLGFLAAMLLRTTGVLPEPVLAIGEMLQTFLLATAMFGLGLGVHLRSLVRSGGRALVLALISTVLIIIVALVGTMLFPPLG